MKIGPVSEIEHHLKVLVYGDPGVGKTHFAVTAENHKAMQRTLIVNVEGGMLTVSHTSADATEQVTTVQEVEDILWGIKGGDEQYAEYQTLVIDSGTELQTLDLESIVREAKKTNKKRDLADIHLQDYGKSTARLKRIFRMARDLPINVIVTALVRRVLPPGDGKNRDPLAVLPQFTEKLATSLMGYMDSVWYMYLGDEGKRTLLTSAEGVTKAKTRGMRFAAELGQVVVEPDLPTIFDLLQSTEGKQS